MKEIFCPVCAYKLEKVEIPRTSTSYPQFDEESGKIIIDRSDLCFNKNCMNGKVNICYYLQGGHIKPFEHIFIIVASIVLVIAPFILVSFIKDINIIELPLLILGILLIPFGMIWGIRDCSRCGYKKD